MSGIAGIIHFDGRPVVASEIEGMTSAMAYRGPDGVQHWVNGSVALGHCMTCSTPESLEETQPASDDGAGLVLVMDGRVDNWVELRRELLGKGACLRSRADAELLLRAYEVWGEECLRHVEGDFAFAIWDARRQSLFCARDRVGNRQFHFHWNGISIAFATDVHPILGLPWIPEQVDEETLAEYLATDWLTIDTTLWQAAKRLKPAHHMTFSGNHAPRSIEYWSPDPFGVLPCRSDADYIAHYRDVFTDVVRRTLRSHRPLAIEVSGGLDSSSIFATAKLLQAEGRLLAPDARGYALDFKDDPRADEVDYALQVGAFHGVAVHLLPPARFPLTWYRDAARRFRVFPNFPNGAMHQHIFEQAAGSGSRVLVSGTGGDEWSGGGVPYAEALEMGDWREIRRVWRGERIALGLPRAGIRFMRNGPTQLLPEAAKRLLRLGRDFASGGEERRQVWLTSRMRERLKSVRARQASSPERIIVRYGQRRLWAQLHEPYSQLAKGVLERSCALSGLDWRQPFWSQRLIEFAFAVPEHLRNRAGINRWLHRQAMRGRLPEAVRLRKDKAEFSSTFRMHWPELSEEIRHILLRRKGWVHEEQIRTLMLRAFTPQSKSWDEGPPWVMFGLDAALP